MGTKILAGTSGYNYKAWRGHFYPPDVHQDQWLAYYASRLPTVEINNTFYRLPRSHVMETWRDSVPSSFRFVIRGSRRITHQKRLTDCAEPLRDLLSAAEILGEKLGVLLFQLPPDMRVELDRLRAFQRALPAGMPVAFEFLHPSWADAAVDEALRAQGHARVLVHDDGEPAGGIAAWPLVYLRLRATRYTAEALRRWRDAVHETGAGQGFVFFSHEESAPRTAAELMALSREEPTRPAARAPRQTAAPGAEPGPAAGKASAKHGEDTG